MAVHGVFFQLQNGGELIQDTAAQFLQGLPFKDIRGGLNDFFQSFAVIFDGGDKVVAAKGRDDGDQHLFKGQFGFFLIVVDIVFEDHPGGRCLSGLTGTKDDAHVPVLQLFPNEVYQFKAAVLGLHDHIEKNHRNVRVLRQELPGFPKRCRHEETEIFAPDTPFP